MHRAIVLILDLFLVASAWGQISPREIVDPSGQTVEELVTQALQENGNLLAGQERVAMARGDLLQAGLRPNPMMSVNGMKGAGSPMNSFQVGATLPLELFGRRERRMDVAQQTLEAVEYQQLEQERELRSLVESKLGEVLAAFRDLQIMDELWDLNGEALDLVEARATGGAIPRLDADLLRVEVNRIDALRANAEAKLGVATLELKSLIGLTPEDPLQVWGELASQPFPLTEIEAVERALSTRPDILWAREMEEVADARLQQAVTKGKLDASVSAAYQRSDNGFPQRAFAPDRNLTRIQEVFHQLSVGVSITLPVRDRNQGAVATADAEIRSAERTREYAELVARQELAAAFLARRKAEDALSIYEEGVLGQSRENLEVVRRTYELGRNQLLDVVAEQRRLIEAEMGYTEALLRYYQATVALRRAANVN